MLVALVTTLSLTTPTSVLTRVWLVAAVSAIAVGGILQLVDRWTRSAVVVEFVVCTIAVVATGGPASVLAPLLIAPAFPAGVILGVAIGTVAPLLALFAVLGSHALAMKATDWNLVAGTAAQWAGLGVLLGFLGAWSARLVRDSEEKPSYATAHRLLSELRAVTRRLPTGLDSRAIATRILTDIGDVMPFVEGTVSVHGRASQLVPIAHSGDSGAIPRQLMPPISEHRPAGADVVLKTIELPLSAGDRDVGVITLSGGTFSAAEVAVVTQMLAPFGTQLDAALLFDEVRELATVEERHRLARNIHDGIAQELVSVSYALDNALGESRQDLMAEQVVSARTELRRVLGELRLSIYELRSDIRSTVSLATALSSYVHSIGRDWGMTIHVSAVESQGRLSPECESELLRIAQEALTNARKHAAAENIWVTLTVQAPHARLRIEDDGTGFANTHSPKSFGLHIMSERATRVGATFSVAPRAARGTIVEVVLGQPSDADETPAHVVTVPA